ncbi:P-type conjugative transfer protein TrbG [Stutzerimonas kunmingensis]|uniref:P-type conjugative transfer protein TrbG n=1 Tax=Stutzerimonas kunmingensis TaxID=1211807 RepID=UPI0005B3E96B|nr:P-type conjugative transfer protein TrbG [Stutzerimonas kunmingensis]
MRKSAVLLLCPILIAVASGCASRREPPPAIPLDEPVAAQQLAEPPKPIEIVTLPQPLALPAQLKPLARTRTEPEPVDERTRVSKANADARVEPAQDGYLNAIQVWPFSDGALYQLYASPGRVTAINLEPGEELITVAAGDTTRWIVGDTSSGMGDTERVSILVKPTRVDITTNMVITTNRRTYLVELTSTEQAWMASVSWDYPNDRLLALKRHAAEALAAAPIDLGLALEKLNFSYAIHGSNPSWKPLRAFDDGRKVYIQFPPGIAQGELPPLFVIGAHGDGQLVNYRVRTPYYIVDRLFAAAELRLGADKGDVVRIERTDVLAGALQ